MFKSLGRWIRDQFAPPLKPEEWEKIRGELLQQTPVPVFWLFGKTGSGKSSIVQFLTKAEKAQIGNGFQPETKFSAKYAFPSEESPIVQFLDTRGLGESKYDPQEDIEQFDSQTHLMIVVVRIKDEALEPILKPLRQIRKARPERPVVLALTCLHEAYPGQQHSDPDPFNETLFPENIPPGLKDAIQRKHDKFSGLVDRFVPIDLTPVEEGFEDPTFGGDRLKQTLLELLPDAHRQTIMNLQDVMKSLKDLHDRRATPYILSAATMAASAGAVPIPYVDLPVVAGIQMELVRRLSTLYGQSLGVQEALTTAGVLGGPLVLRQMLRESMKMIPVIGSAASATLAFASTYALGKAACWYYGEYLSGHAPTNEELREKYRQQMDIAKSLWQRHRAGEE